MTPGRTGGAVSMRTRVESSASPLAEASRERPCSTSEGERRARARALEGRRGARDHRRAVLVVRRDRDGARAGGGSGGPGRAARRRLRRSRRRISCSRRGGHAPRRLLLPGRRGPRCGRGRPRAPPPRVQLSASNVVDQARRVGRQRFPRRAPHGVPRVHPPPERLFAAAERAGLAASWEHHGALWRIAGFERSS